MVELQLDCNNTNNIYNAVNKLLSDKNAIEKQLTKSRKIINNFKTENPSKIASSVIESYFWFFSLLITTSLLSERIIL